MHFLMAPFNVGPAHVGLDNAKFGSKIIVRKVQIEYSLFLTLETVELSSIMCGALC